MSQFCIQCGQALPAGTRFCSHCGADNAPAPANAPSKERRWRRALAFVLTLAVGILLGWFLHRCPACGPPTPMAHGTGNGGGGGGHSPGEPGPGGPHHPGAGGGAGGGGGGGGEGTTPPGSGKSGRGDGDGDNPTGSMKGSGSNGDDDPSSSHIDPKAVEGTDVSQLVHGLPGSRGNTPVGAGTDPPGEQIVAAKDFSYDRTGLPHYPTAVTQVASAISYPAGKTPDAATGSGVKIHSTSPFDQVVAWYRQNLPPGWHDQTIGDFGQLGRTAAQITPDNLLKMIAGDNKAISTSAPSGSEDIIRLSMFKPPEGSHEKRSLMIMQKGEQPVQIMLQADLAP